MMEDGNSGIGCFVPTYFIYAHGKEGMAAETRIAIDAELNWRHNLDPANTQTGRDYGH